MTMIRSECLPRLNIDLAPREATQASQLQLGVPEPTAICALCCRAVPKRLITLHHLKPKSRGGKAEHRVPLCKPCHKQIHATFDNRTLEKSLDDLASLRSHPAMTAFMAWIVKQSPHRTFSTAISGKHPDARRRR